MPNYRVDIDGDTVWSDTIDGDGSVRHFPDEYTDRPKSGAVHLVIDDVIVGVQIPQADEDVIAAATAAVESEG